MLLLRCLNPRRCLALCTFLVSLICVVSRLPIKTFSRSQLPAVLDQYASLLNQSQLEPPAVAPNILLLQHIQSFNPLRCASITTHKLYAAVHGYRCHCDKSSYVPENRPKKERTMNKMYLIRDTILAEIDKGEHGAEWILWGNIPALLSVQADQGSPIQLDRQ